MSVLHLWFGLLSSVVIFIICLSGSIYAFKQQIENVVNSDKVFIENLSNSKVSLDIIYTDFKNKFGEPTKIIIPKALNKSIFISNVKRNNSGVSAYYHPDSGAFLGVKNEKTITFFSFILDLHRFLLLDDTGKLITGIATLFFVFLLFSGFIMWLPKKIKNLKKQLTIKFKSNFFRLNYDLHRVLGFYAIPLLSFIAITGLYVSFHWVKNGIIVGLGGDSIIISNSNTALTKNLSDSFNLLYDELKEKEVVVKKERVGIQQIVKKVDSTFNYLGTLDIKLPDDNEKYFLVTKTNNINGFLVPDLIELELDGNIKRMVPFISLSLSEKFKKIAKPLHTGEIMGLFSIIIYFIMSLVGCLLPITGFVIFIKKTRFLNR